MELEVLCAYSRAIVYFSSHFPYTSSYVGGPFHKTVSWITSLYSKWMKSSTGDDPIWSSSILTGHKMLVYRYLLLRSTIHLTVHRMTAVVRQQSAFVVWYSSTQIYVVWYVPIVVFYHQVAFSSYVNSTKVRTRADVVVILMKIFRFRSVYI